MFVGESARGGDPEPHNLRGGKRRWSLIALLGEAPEEATRSLKTLEREAPSKQEVSKASVVG
jgi:hypothetical protein